MEYNIKVEGDVAIVTVTSGGLELLQFKLPSYASIHTLKHNIESFLYLYEEVKKDFKK